VAPEIEPAIGWLCVLRSLPWRSGSQTVERSTTRTVSWLASNRQSVPCSIDPKISAIMSTLTLASRMAGFGCPMCPLDFLRSLSVLTSGLRQYVHTASSVTTVQNCSHTNYDHLFTVPSSLHHLKIRLWKECTNTKDFFAFNGHRRCHIEVAIPCIAASAHTIDRNCDVLPIVEYSIETDDGQTLNWDMYHYYFNKNLLWEIVSDAFGPNWDLGKNRAMYLFTENSQNVVTWRIRL
jgi:hypothetical protein